jgi:hypothetical protein
MREKHMGFKRTRMPYNEVRLPSWWIIPFARVFWMLSKSVPTWEKSCGRMKKRFQNNENNPCKA